MARIRLAVMTGDWMDYSTLKKVGMLEYDSQRPPFRADGGLLVNAVNPGYTKIWRMRKCK
jgi:hypothetical protein